MDGIGGKPGWAWIFIIEGLFTVVCALVTPFILQDFPDTAKFISEPERKLKPKLWKAYCSYSCCCAKVSG